MNWMKTTFAGLLSVAVLFSSAAAQDTPQDPTRSALRLHSRASGRSNWP